MNARRLRFAAAITVVVTVLVGLLVSGGGLPGLSRQLADAWYPTGPVDARLAVVELPAAATGWDRAVHAELITALGSAGAEVVGYDVVFRSERPGEPELEAALAAAGNIVLAATVTLAGGEPGVTDVPTIVAAELPRPGLLAASAGTGHANVVASPLDGVVRQVPLVVEDAERRLLPALSLAVVSVAEGIDPGAITLRVGSGVAIGSRLVPTGEQRLLEVNWALPWTPGGAAGGSEVAFTAAQVLAGEADLRGRIVFVGVADLLTDVVPTPVNRPAMPGVYVHANAANTLLTGLYRRGPDDRTTILAVALLAGIVGAVGMVARLALVPVLGLGLGIVWQVVVASEFRSGRTLDTLWPTVAIILSVGGVVGARYLTEVRERRRVAGLFRQYIPDRVAESLLASDRLAAAVEGERVEVTVLFCDLRGFTATAAMLEPAAVRAMLEVYYDHCTRIIHAHDGTVMQFVGDEVFAVFGAPLPQTDHAQRAVDAARQLQAAAVEVNAELAGQGVTLAYGIGLNSGEVVAAHVGSRVHKQYAVVGQTVNVGARLCSLAHPGQIVVSRWTREALGGALTVSSLGRVELKGVNVDPEPAVLLGG